VFGCKCFVINNGKENLGKFDAKFDEGIHIGYALNDHAYRAFNKRLLTVEESMHVVFDESDNYMPKPVSDDLECDDLRSVLHKNELIHIDVDDSRVVKEPTVSADLPKEWKTPRDFTLDNVIGNIEKGVSTRNSLNNLYETMTFVSQEEPKNLDETLRENNWILAV